MIALLILAIAGFCLSLYAYIIEQRMRISPNYKPLCDISQTISCSKVAKSPYASLFFVSNALIGMFFYVGVIVLTLLQAYTLLLIASIGSCVVSLFLAYILYFKIKAICLICTFLYCINACIMLMTLKMLYA